MIWDAESHYPKDYCPFHNILAKMQTQSLTTKESKLKKSKPKESKSANKRFLALLRINKLVKFTYQKKKKSIEKKNKTRKTLSQQLRITSLKIKINMATRNAIITKKKAILPGIAPSFQKTNIGFGNIHANK